MTTPLFLVLGIGLLLALVCVGWWRMRRQPEPLWAVVPVAKNPQETSVVPIAVSTASPTVVTAPDARVLMHRLHALAFEEVASDGAIPAAHVALVADAEALLARIEAQPKYTPRRPQLLPQLMRAANDPDASLESIARIIAQDPTLSANLLRIANSAFYRVSTKPVESIERAITLLGLDGLRPVIAAALVQPVMRTGEGAFGRLPSVIWDHTLLSAAAAAEYARRVERDDVFAAQLLGLLQGLGAIIVVQVMRDLYAQQRDLTPDARVVARLLDAWSGLTARRIAESWGLSGRMADALEAQQSDALPAGPLGRALRVGRIAGALALLCRLGKLDDDEGFALLSALDLGTFIEWNPAAFWQRLRV
jgi:HD-like signal output (HDOD) protein